MKKTLSIIVCATLLMFACNNKPTTPPAAETTTVETPAVEPVDSPIVEDDGPSGTPTMPAHVFDELTEIGIVDATVTATQNGRVKSSAKTSSTGKYALAGLVVNQSYVISAAKNTYRTQTKTITYTDTLSLPVFVLVKN